jgi:DNA-binding transcriptional ArsR family regulator
MATRLSADEIRERFQFTIGVRFEVFYALQVLADPHARIHREWKESALAALPEGFVSELEGVGGPSVSMASDALRDAPADLDFDGMISTLQGVRIEDFQREILLGTLHVDLAEDLMNDGRSLAEAIARVPRTERDWLGYLDLYPHDPSVPLARALSLLVEDPEAFRRQLVRVLAVFWDRVFRQTWEQLRPQMKQSLAEKERFFNCCSFGEFARAALLRIEIDERKQEIVPIRGGCRTPLRTIRAAAVLPSAFNDKRFWAHFAEADGTTVAFFPYFDPSLAVERSGSASAFADPELDPALICKALGDGTRFAIMTLIGRSPRSSAELAEHLSLSRATISHHVYLLRAAGLLEEQHRGGSVYLSPRRGALEALSELLVNRVYRGNSGR